jgi:hypothetical protein
MRVPQMCVGKSDGSITNFKYRGPQMAVEAGVPVGGVAMVSRGSLVPGTAWAIASGVVAVSARRRSKSRGRDSRSRGSQKCRPRCDRLVAFSPRRFVLREGLVLGPDFERRLTAGARADYLPDAFSFPGGEGARPFGLGLECQIMGWRHGAVDVRNTRTKTCGRAPTLRHRGSTIH